MNPFHNLADALHTAAELAEHLADLAEHEKVDAALAILGALARDPSRINACLELSMGSDIEVVSAVLHSGRP